MKTNRDMDYPRNLLDAIASVGKDEPCEWEHEVPPDINGTVEYVIETLPIERERDILHAYYRDGDSYRTIAAVYGVTQERIRQVVAKAVKKLSAQSRIQWLIDGVQGRVQAAADRARTRQTTAELRSAICSIEKIAEYLSEMTGKPELADTIVEYARDLRMDAPIEELGLTVRSYNALRRRGVDTVERLTEMSIADITKMRNIGARSAKEIVDRAHAFGLKLKSE